MPRLAGELLLLDDRAGGFSGVPGRTLGYALDGAALMGLALEGRVDTDTDSLILAEGSEVSSAAAALTCTVAE